MPAKMQALESLLTDIIVQRGEKVIVWSYYTASIEGIMNRFSNFNPVRIDGTVTDINERRNSVDKFQNDNETMLFVGNPAAAGAGITLHRARFAIYESMSNQAAHYLQSLDRIHRRGQTNSDRRLINPSPTCRHSSRCDGHIVLMSPRRDVDPANLRRYSP